VTCDSIFHFVVILEYLWVTESIPVKLTKKSSLRVPT